VNRLFPASFELAPRITTIVELRPCRATVHGGLELMKRPPRVHRCEGEGHDHLRTGWVGSAIVALVEQLAHARRQIPAAWRICWLQCRQRFVRVHGLDQARRQSEAMGHKRRPDRQADIELEFSRTPSELFVQSSVAYTAKKMKTARLARLEDHGPLPRRAEQAGNLIDVVRSMPVVTVDRQDVDVDQDHEGSAAASCLGDARPAGHLVVGVD